MFAIWGFFLYVYVAKAARDPWYLPFVALLAAAGVVRLAAWLRPRVV
jgi:hypothetical protein